MDNMLIYKGIIKEFNDNLEPGRKYEAMYRIINFNDTYFFAEEISSGCVFPIYTRMISGGQYKGLMNHVSCLSSGNFYAFFCVKMYNNNLFRFIPDIESLEENNVVNPSIEEVNAYLKSKQKDRKWNNMMMDFEKSNEYMCDLSIIKEKIMRLKDGEEVFDILSDDDKPKYVRYKSDINLKEISNIGYDLSTQDNLCNLVGRKKELKKTIKAIGIQGSSVILIGEPGSGKTSIVEKMALDIRNNDCKYLRGKIIFALDTSALVGGTKYRGDYEEKLNKLLHYCKENKGHIILFIDEVHTLYGMGASEGSSNTVTLDILKPYVSRRDITIIGATTKKEFEKTLAKDPAFVRRMEIVEVPVLDREMNIEIMLSFMQELELKYRMKLNLDDKQKLLVINNILDLTDNKCSVVAGVVKIENPTLAKKIIENAFTEARYNGNRKVTLDDINFSISEYDQLSIEFMSEFGYDLSTQDNLCNLVGRENETKKVIKSIAIEGNSVLLVGDSGTGKTSIVEKMALDIKNGCSEFLKDKIIFYLNVKSLTIDSKFRGEFEEKMNKLINCCKKNKGNIILFIDEIHTLYGLGRSVDSSIDAMNILKPYMSKGDIIVIGTTTNEEYQKYMANDPAFLRRLDKVDVCPLGKKEIIQILISWVSDLEKKYNIEMNLNGISLYHLMEYIVEITDVKCQMVEGNVKVGNPTIAKRLVEDAFSDAVFFKKTSVSLEDICFAISDCDKLLVEFRKECVLGLKEYVNSQMPKSDVLGYIRSRKK